MKQIAKYIQFIGLAIIWASSFDVAAQTVQYLTLSATNNYRSTSFPIQTNQIVSVVGYDWNDKPSLTGNLVDGTVLQLTPYAQSGNNNAVTSSQIPQTVTGLTNITVISGIATSVWATFQITTPASANIVSNYVPADAIVIPASTTGNVQIILESSMDLVNWTAANPGTYGASSATNRFFRVRAVHN